MLTDTHTDRLTQSKKPCHAKHGRGLMMELDSAYVPISIIYVVMHALMGSFTRYEVSKM